MIAELPDLRPSLIRIIMRPGVERATVEKLSDVGFEFPSINYKLVSERPYRFAYGAVDSPQAGGAYGSAIIKVDVETGEARSFGNGAHVFGEPLFVPRPQGDGEDDGVLLTVGSAQDTESMLAIIDARSMALVASATVQSSIPLGFHGRGCPRLICEKHNPDLAYLTCRPARRRCVTEAGDVSPPYDCAYFAPAPGGVVFGASPSSTRPSFRRSRPSCALR
jgi:hypothetical protein